MQNLSLFSFLLKLQSPAAFDYKNADEAATYSIMV